MSGLRSLLGGRGAKAPARSSDEVTLYYASDVHGSESCWRKFLGAPKFYKSNVLIMGGDLAGKAFVPIVQGEAGRWNATLFGEERRNLDEAGVAELEKQIRFNGLYPYRTTREQVRLLAAAPALASEVFHTLLVTGLERWCSLADERLADDVEALIMCGNDDPLALDEPLKQSTRLTFCDDCIVTVAGHEIVSLSYSNRTPFDSERELDEDALYDRVARLAEQLEQPSRAIFNLHVPPYASGLDTATRLDETLAPVYVGGAPEEIPVGSTAVRELIERFQPLLSLHGHIHESRGVAQIGRTLAVNPGSDYASGRLDGCLVTVRPDELERYQLVSG